MLIAAFGPTAPLVVTPELVLIVLVPGLVFEAAYRLDFNELRRTYIGVAILAIPGVLVSAGVDIDRHDGERQQRIGWLCIAPVGRRDIGLWRGVGRQRRGVEGERLRDVKHEFTLAHNLSLPRALPVEEHRPVVPVPGSCAPT